MATLQTRPKAIVIGAGPVGCLSAIALAKQGWNVEIYEGRAGMPLLLLTGEA
jgi:kynurenine 3-monooxygenase